MSTTQSQFPPDMAEVRWAIEVLEQRDARIHALLSVIGDSIDEDTIDHTLYRLAFETAEDNTPWQRLRKVLGMPQSEGQPEVAK